jgi:hypothetical protein
MSITEVKQQDVVTENKGPLVTQNLIIVPPALQIWLADMLAAVKAENEKLQSSIEASIAKLQENNNYRK